MIIEKIISATKTIAQKTGTTVNITRHGNQFAQNVSVKLGNQKLGTLISVAGSTKGNFKMNFAQDLFETGHLEGGILKKGKTIKYGGSASIPKLSEMVDSAKEFGEITLQKARAGFESIKERLVG